MDRLSQPAPGSAPLAFDSPFPQPLWAQYLIILKKNTICYWRYPQVSDFGMFMC